MTSGYYRLAFLSVNQQASTPVVFPVENRCAYHIVGQTCSDQSSALMAGAINAIRAVVASDCLSPAYRASRVVCMSVSMSMSVCISHERETSKWALYALVRSKPKRFQMLRKCISANNWITQVVRQRGLVHADCVYVGINHKVSREGQAPGARDIVDMQSFRSD